MYLPTLLALLLSINLVNSQEKIYQGFNSGSTLADSAKTPKRQADFKSEFETAQALSHSPGVFNSVRLYTNIQEKTTNSPIEAFPAAIATNTSILLGIWCSGTDTIENELTALSNAITQYGSAFTNLVVGISVGSEDMYRVSESGIKNKAGLGKPASAIISFIKDTREAIAGTPLAGVPVGHVDAWTAWGNSSNSDLIDEVDFVGMDIYPYYEDNLENSIENSTEIFQMTLRNVTNAAGEKPVWITETGWPNAGPTSGKAVASVENAKSYWDRVGCTLFGRTNTWWYILRDSNPDNEEKFGLTQELSPLAAFNLTCPASSGAPASVNLAPVKDKKSTASVFTAEGSSNLFLVVSVLLGGLGFWL